MHWGLNSGNSFGHNFPTLYTFMEGIFLNVLFQLLSVNSTLKEARETPQQTMGMHTLGITVFVCFSS